MSQNKFFHTSVMPAEVLQLLQPKDNEIYIDATFGAGGHTRKILQQSNCNVIGIDRDESVMEFAQNIQNEFGNRFHFINAQFSKISQVVAKPIHGVIFDIGVSSMQIDNQERGFSLMRNGPLTMTMGQNTLSAYDVVNYFSEDKIADILLEYGDEPKAKEIAKAICIERNIKPITTTLELAGIVESIIKRTGKIHPATLTFQAIRVFVNDELNELEIGLKSALNIIEVNGKVIVITFQGLEDKIVKNIFKHYTHKPHTNKFKHQSSEKIFKNLTGDVVKPSREETKFNVRARSAKIRAVIRVS